MNPHPPPPSTLDAFGATTPPPGRVLVVDDHRNMAAATALSLRHAGYFVTEAVGGAEAFDRLSEETFDVVITDLRMDPVDGLQVLRRTLELSPTTQVVVMTAYATVQNAVEAMQAGANEYITKPFEDDALLVKVSKALEKRRLVTQVKLLSNEFQDRYQLDRIIGRSAPIRELVQRILRVAQTDATVLITGESGTGKELVARAIHAASKRADQPFVPVNCAAIPEQLLEAELFGHAKGAYTGAIKARRGLFEEAAGGTFFFDEVAETAPAFQAKLLRAIQEGEVRRVGENASVRVDVRIIAATNVDLRAAIAEKRFREDLYYRLNVVPMRVPTLRERREDIPQLAEYFLARFAERNGRTYRFSPAALDRLLGYPFPGNVRELENVVEQGAALAGSEVIEANDLLLEPENLTGPAPEMSLAASVDEAERVAIRRALDASGGDLQLACRSLRVSGTTLWRKMKRLHITR